MRTQLRLNSVVPHGVGSSFVTTEIEIIYGYLIRRFQQNFYRYISINQIGDDLQEFVATRPGGVIHCNIRYPAYPDFETKSELEQNLIRLDVINNAVLRMAEYDKKFDPAKLEDIRNEIISRKCSFEILIKKYVNKKSPHLMAKIMVQPAMRHFDYYILVEKSEIEVCRVNFYKGLPDSIYDFRNFFGVGRWESESIFMLTGKLKEVETRVNVFTGKMDVINLTPFNKPPQYTLMQADVPEHERQMAVLNCRSQLRP